MVWLLGCHLILTVDEAPADTAVVADPEEHVGGVDSVDGDDAGPCGPGAADVHATEGDAIEVTVGCTRGGEAVDWTLPELPAGAQFDAATRTLSWTPDLGQAGKWEIPVQATSDRLERGAMVVWVADAWHQRDNEPVVPSAYHEEYGLPVFHLTRPEETSPWRDTPSEVTYRGHTYQIELQLRGAASLSYPKNSYKMDFDKEDEFEDESVGFDKRRNVVLTSTFDDNAYFRQKLCFDIWNAIRPGRAAKVQSFFAVVYINTEYEGLYLVTDHVDAEYWQDQGYVEEINLYKSVDHQANFYDSYGAKKTSWHAGYEKKEDVTGDWEDLDTLVFMVATADDAEFESTIAERFSIEDAYDWWYTVVYTEADDSGGKNAYLFNDPADPIFRHVPWDFNHSLGQTWQTEREPATYAEDFTGTNNLFRRLLLSPTYGGPMVQGMLDHLDGALSVGEMNALIDAYQEQIAPSAARDWEKWEGDYRTYSGWNWRDDWTDNEEEVEYVRGWLAERNDFIRRWMGG